MLSSRTRSALLGLVLLVAAAGIVAGVGRNPAAAAPDTYLEAIGELDGRVDARVRELRTDGLIDAARILDVVGGSEVTVPLRIGVVVLLLGLRRFSAAFAFGLAWALTAPVTEALKSWLHRGRPPNGLVDVSTFSMPSGHTVAIVSIGVALAIALATGWRRGLLVIVALLAGAAMGASRMVLSVHWLSDAGVSLLFGAGAAIVSAVIVDVVAQRVPERRSLTRAPG